MTYAKVFGTHQPHRPTHASEKTGSAEQLASKLGISRSTLFETLNLMKDYGAEIAYCPHRQTYYYTQEGRFEIGFKPKNKLSKDDMEKISGGHKKYFTQSDIIAHLPFMFATVNRFTIVQNIWFNIEATAIVKKHAQALKILHSVKIDEFALVQNLSDRHIHH
ncbi:MAG: hypothetical protein OHK0057_01980 [Thermoflexibacter sp.]